MKNQNSSVMLLRKDWFGGNNSHLSVESLFLQGIFSCHLVCGGVEVPLCASRNSMEEMPRKLKAFNRYLLLDLILAEQGVVYAHPPGSDTIV